ncbi:MAG: AcrR family transcriptional regulator [Parvicella sp.]|jgi:AcrR family transcriptional regulator
MGRKSVEKERKQLNKKQKIWLANSLPFFYKEGIVGPTMNDIATYLGLSKATIYNYYESKEDLVHDSLWVKLKELEGFRDLLFNEDLDFVERYYEGVNFFAQSLTGMTNAYLKDLKENFPNSWESVELFQTKSVENLRTYYEMGIQKGIFRPFNVHVMASYDMVFFNMMLDPSFLKENQITVEQAFSEYFNMKFNGILVKRDLSIINNYQKN